MRPGVAEELLDSIEVPGLAVSSASYHPTGLSASLGVEVAVVRSAKARLCSKCRRKRVLYALTFTEAVLGNPAYPWVCGPCGGLRPESKR